MTLKKKTIFKKEHMSTKITITLQDEQYDLLKTTSKDSTDLLIKVAKLTEKDVHVQKGLVGGKYHSEKPRR